MIYGYITLHYSIIFILTHISFPLLMYHFKYFPKNETSRYPSLIRNCMNLYFWLAYIKCDISKIGYTVLIKNVTTVKYQLSLSSILKKCAYGYWKSFTCDCFMYYWLFMEMSFCWRVPCKLSKQLIIHQIAPCWKYYVWELPWLWFPFL